METPLPPFVPEYRKPEGPGVWMNFDNTVSLRHIVEPADGFADAAQAVFALVQEAQARFPDWPRVLYLDVHGHKGPHHGFDADFFEFQQEFFFATLAPFLTGFETPLTGPLINPVPQRNDLPDRLVVDGDAR